MATTENPLLWQSYKLDPKSPGFMNSIRLLLKSLGQWANQMQATLFSATQLAAVLNGQGALASTAVVSVTTDFGTVTTNQSVNCLNAAFIVVRVGVNATAFTLTLQNLNPGAQFFLFFANINAAACTFKMAGTTPTLAITAAISNAPVDMVATGTSIAAGGRRAFFGSAITTNLWLGFS